MGQVFPSDDGQPAQPSAIGDNKKGRPAVRVSPTEPLCFREKMAKPTFGHQVVAK